MKVRSGGGITGKNVTRQPVRTGSGSFAKSVKATSQIGTSVGNHVTGKSKVLRSTQRDLDAGRGFQPVKFGNLIALDVGRGGPGSGRNLYGQAGSQGQHGPVAGTRRTPSKSFD
jgi:hypothetical protein